ncbi:MAG: Gfo/Idh/MocA family oxidoreductase [Acidobacteria bacterium]|nr:Gfo/Idh/MocA family oxidoreductase [Acidobacteriota bacterium]
MEPDQTMNSGISRRGVLRGITASSAMRVMGANDRVRLGIVGTGLRGEYLMQRANAAGGIQWVAVCDAYDVRRDKAEKTAGTPVEKYVDYRRMVDRKDIDGIILATWDNTHCDIAVAVLESGKDLYIEKPMTLHPMEGRRIVGAVRSHKRILQTGTQQRSHPHFAEAKAKFIDSGRIGKITCVRTYWNSNLAYRNQKPPDGMERKPAGLDWDACQGSLPKLPWDPKRYFNHYVYWDYSTNAQMGGLFVHMIDIVHWYCKVQQPLAADCFGGIYLGGEGRDTADHINAIVHYPNNLLVTFEANVADGIRRENQDMVFMGTAGRLHIFRYGYRFLSSEDDGKTEITAGTTPDLHVANWLDCIRTRKKAACDEEAGHYSAMACHVCNIAYREQRRVQWNKEWTI